jgi:predicted regulator of Ras-like GTPase activity (Roadblock/LC7/MglB family)
MNPAELDFLLERFVQETPGVSHAQTVSADGMHLAASYGIDATQADQFAAISSGLASLTDSAADTFDLHPVVRQVIETGQGWILVARINNRASLGVVCDHSVDLGLVGYEMTLLAEKAGSMLSPQVIERLKNTLGV